MILAHRGASAERPENTESAFRLALDDGADGVELDVMRCRPFGEVVVVRDEDLGRLAGQPKVVVAKTSWTELKDLDVGSWFGAAHASARLLTLPQALEVLGPRALCNVELKGRGLGDPKLASEVAAILASAPTPDRFGVSSFNPFHLYRLRSAAPQLATGLLFSPGPEFAAPLRRRAAVAALRPAPRAAFVHRGEPHALEGERLRRGHLDDRSAGGRLVALHGAGVRGIVSNRPRGLLAAFEDLRR